MFCNLYKDAGSKCQALSRNCNAVNTCAETEFSLGFASNPIQ